jgi:signal-transduction protein with cAMP-binding, CBS, and nucleotidyltransferase domain
MRTVKDILGVKGGDLWWIGADATVFEALDLMKAKDIGALLVKDAKRNVVGIFSERDYARKIVLQGKASKEVRVREVMTPADHMIVVRPENRVDECMAIMTERHIRHLPVVDRHSVIGMVSSRDLIQAYLEDHESHIDNLQELCETFFSHRFDDEIVGNRG